MVNLTECAPENVVFKAAWSFQEYPPDMGEKRQTSR